ncbi:SRA-YDG protein [Cylindrobasidium torrendii FP15055 ss-10]|uniref:SRA-YDG protein n=1 Tax=Cylindrobasidium torrendii FP15055 ss-10 TaxID=1314674 RepID=A0A0D7B5T0_9AGAR|nr:SRA-YDG protein [Cylindrobasidium torrendii FP15055 ss-10]
MEAKRRELAQQTHLFAPGVLDSKRPLKDAYGPVNGIPVGCTWPSRGECSQAGVHRAFRAGICGGPDGAYSICTSGGYDDKDEGDVLIYTGTGGRDNFGSGPMTHDQSRKHLQNAALIRSIETGQPVRVIRGGASTSPYAPYNGYRYDGLYRVVDEWESENRDGFKIIQFRLERLPNQSPAPYNKAT